MFCKNCGTEMDENAVVCPNCGTSSAPSFVAPAPVQNIVQAAPTVKYEIPPENRPLSPWAYFGLQLLFSVPIVGFVFLIVFSCSGANINRRNFARSYWCALLIVAAIVLVYVLIAVVLGISLASGSSASYRYY